MPMLWVQGPHLRTMDQATLSPNHWVHSVTRKARVNPNPLYQPLGAFSDKENQSESKSTLRTERFLFFLPSARSFVHSFLPSCLSFSLPAFLSPFLPFFLSFLYEGYVRIVRRWCSPQPSEGLPSPHSPADRATPAVAKLPLPRGPGKSSEYVGSQVTKGPGGPTPIPALLTHVQERGHHEILPGGTGRLPEDPQSHTSGHTHPQLFKIPPFLLFSCLPCTPTNCHAQA